MNGADIWLKNRILAPGYYWKAVCDPINKQSIFFFAKNNVGNVDDVKEKGCSNVKQTKKYGVIKCTSISNAEAKLPDFHKNCKPEEEGIEFKEYILTHSKMFF